MVSPSLLTLPGLFLLLSSQLALTAVMRRWRKHTMYSGGHRAVGCCSTHTTHTLDSGRKHMRKNLWVFNVFVFFCNTEDLF